ncbi:hypothetical protein MXB_645, partial [Myxobolus squamalis]
IKLDCLDEWYIIELQGHLETDEISFKDSLGRLYFTTDNTPYLLIGQNKIKGVVIKLKNPYVIMSKNIQNAIKSFKIVAVVHNLILFKTRPLPFL